MSVARPLDIAYVRLAAPDLAVQARFLTDFGLVDLGLHGDVQLFASANEAPFCYIVEQGEAKFLGFGLWVESTEALEALAAREGRRVQSLGLPGGGSYVRMTDPDGFEIDAVAGQSFRSDGTSECPVDWNENGLRRRVDSFRRTEKGPSHVLRLGHLGMAVTDFRRSEGWYKDRFGLLTSEEFETAPGKPLGAFMRLNRGETPTDHHTVVLIESPRRGCAMSPLRLPGSMT
ncbi:hypothetical protein [Niveispirillum fermenti]|uniref:hypothetical protein n=1 Tax=Niveispirillum fermenti TaxID=1233113 RepID=UPI004040EC81